MREGVPASLQIRLKKGNDGRVASFALHRADGSHTVMRNINPFFPIHDLTHYAVESVLCFRRGFYGLVCEGWAFEDFGSPWPRGPLPDDMDPAECLVGLFDLERASGFVMTVEQINEQLTDYLKRHPGVSARPLTQADVDTIRERVRTYSARWGELAPGGTLTLEYRPGEDRGP